MLLRSLHDRYAFSMNIRSRVQTLIERLLWLAHRAVGRDPRAARLNLGQFFKSHPPNGKVVSELLLHLCRRERPMRLLAIRTPTTGAWLEGLPIPHQIDVVVLRYAAPCQGERRDANYLSRKQFCAAVQALQDRQELFDLIVIDPFHDYQTSLEDFELCLGCLHQHGVILSHDCAPVSVELADPNFRVGVWCGQTYASLTAFSHQHPNLAITVLDTDTGVALIRSRNSQLRSRWLPPAPLHGDMQDQLIELIEGGRYQDAYYFYRAFGSCLVDLRSAHHERAVDVSNAFRQHGSVVPIQDNAYLFVFHKDLEIGSGPAISLYVNGVELLKYDCYGLGKGHCHLRPHFEQRIPLKAYTIREQIDESIEAILMQSPGCLLQQAEPEMAALILNEQALSGALDRARELLYKLEGAVRA